MSEPVHGEWPAGIPMIEAVDIPKPQPTTTLSFTPDWYEASPLVKEWVDELCELADVPVLEIEQIVITFHHSA